MILKLGQLIPKLPVLAITVSLLVTFAIKILSKQKQNFFL